MWVKKLIKMVVYREKATSESYVKYLRFKGVKIGERTTIFAPRNVMIDLTRPYLIDIGADVQITKDVTILTHGYDWSVLKGVYGEILGSGESVKIGNNVFIGMKSTILKGVCIGNNVIIGANSLVNKNIPDNCVVAGNPVRILMSLDEYYNKRKNAQLYEAVELVKKYRERYGSEPTEKALDEFFWLFCNAESNELPEVWKRQMENVGNGEDSYRKLKINHKAFVDMKAFLNYVK